MASRDECRTFFSKLPDLNDDNMTIETFLKAATLLADFFALWGTRLQLVKSDVEGNVKKVTNAVSNLNCATLFDLLARERTLDLYLKDSSGSVGLLWLKRTFQFLASILWFLSRSSCEDSMRSIILQAYEDSLQRYHSKFMRQTFRVVLHVVPKRETLIKKLAFDRDNCEQQVLEDAVRCRSALLPFVSRLQELLVGFKMEDPL